MQTFENWRSLSHSLHKKVSLHKHRVTRSFVCVEMKPRRGGRPNVISPHIRGTCGCAHHRIENTEDGMDKRNVGDSQSPLRLLIIINIH
jgi:hypothetical protein